MPGGGNKFSHDPGSPCDKTCDAFEACCKRVQKAGSAPLGWSYVGEGRGGYDKIMQLNYVGEGYGDYIDSGMPPAQPGKAWAMCTILLVCAAFLVGLSCALRRCKEGESGFLCSNGAEDFFVAAVREAKVRWQQLSPKEYCHKASVEFDKRQYDFCCQAESPSQDLCRAFSASQLQAGFPSALRKDTMRENDEPRLPPPPADVAAEVGLTTSLAQPLAGTQALSPNRSPALLLTEASTAAPNLRKMELTTRPPHAAAAAVAAASAAAAAMPAAAAATQSYDCAVGWVTWTSSWPDNKKDWCCRQELKGCTEGPPLAAPMAITTTAVRERRRQGGVRAVSDSEFDCIEGSEEDWAPPQKAWCCVHTGHRGCPPIVVS